MENRVKGMAVDALQRPTDGRFRGDLNRGSPGAAAEPFAVLGAQIMNLVADGEIRPLARQYGGRRQQEKFL